MQVKKISHDVDRACACEYSKQETPSILPQLRYYPNVENTQYAVHIQNTLNVNQFYCFTKLY